MTLDRVNRGLLLIAAVLVALSVVRVMGDSRPTTELLDIAGVVADEVSALRFEGPDGALAATRSDDGWLLTEPESLRADSRKIDAEHRTTLTITGNDGSVVDIHLGKSIAGGSHYVRLADTSEVYRGRVPGSSRLSPVLDKWEDKRLLPELAAELVTLEVTNSHGLLALARSSTGEAWQLTGDTARTVDGAKVDGLGRSLGNFTARTVLRGSEAEKARRGAGLESPRATIAVSDSSGNRQTVRLGADHTSKGFLYAELQGDPRLFVLPQSILKNFDKDAAGLVGAN